MFISQTRIRVISYNDISSKMLLSKLFQKPVPGTCMILARKEDIQLIQQFSYCFAFDAATV